MTNGGWTNGGWLRRGAVGLVAAVTVFGGCGREGGVERAETNSGTVAEEEGGATPQEPASGGQVTPTSVPPDEGAGNEPGGDVLASAEAEIASAPGEATVVPVRLDVLSLERLPGELVEARFRVTNVGDGADLKPFFSFTRGSTYDVSGAALIDLLGGFRYEALEDSGRRCLCTVIPITATVPPGESASYYARFGAPPEETVEVDFELPGFPPIRAVPLV